MLEKENYTFMYEDAGKLILMHPESFEQVCASPLVRRKLTRLCFGHLPADLACPAG